MFATNYCILSRDNGGEGMGTPQHGCIGCMRRTAHTVGWGGGGVGGEFWCASVCLCVCVHCCEVRECHRCMLQVFVSYVAIDRQDLFGVGQWTVWW